MHNVPDYIAIGVLIAFGLAAAVVLSRRYR
jgi:hypothetical protein